MDAVTLGARFVSLCRLDDHVLLLDSPTDALSLQSGRGLSGAYEKFNEVARGIKGYKYLSWMVKRC